MIITATATSAERFAPGPTAMAEMVGKARRAYGTLRGVRAVVTGASSGVGHAIARAFGRAGAKVALVARGIDGLEATVRELTLLGADVLAFPVDVSRAELVDGVAQEVVDTWGAIDVWVNDAMVSVMSPVVDTPPGDFRRVIEVDYLGYVHGTLAALRHMRPRNRGSIVQIGSALAYRSIPLQAAYCAAKPAIRGFTDSLRSELLHEHSHVRLTMIQLPAVNTPQFDVMRSRMPEHPQPVPPIYQPEMIARAVVRAVKRPRREVWIGWSAVLAIVGQRLVPGLVDRYLALFGWRAQETTKLPKGHPLRHARDNLDAPLPGDRGAHGVFDRRARRSTTETWAWARAGWLVALALVGLARALTRRP